MLRLFKWMVRGLVAVFVLFVAALSLGYYFASHSLPDYDTEYSLPRLEGEIEIVRDSNAVPHVFASNDLDVFYGLGFAHAQDRLWQMTLLRRTAQGRLSEIFGEETFEIDVLMRALDIYNISVEAAKKQTPEVTSELQAYSNGINAYLELVRAEALGRGSPEFFLFSSPISLWTPADSIAVQKLMALQLSDMARREVQNANLKLRLPDEQLADLLEQSEISVLDLPSFSALENKGTIFAQLDHALNPIKEPGEAGASNAWAAAGSRSATGKPLFANDPHLELTAPSIWMLARLEFESGGVIGGTIPGLPAILVGRNADMAWGLTSSYLDDQDIFLEKLSVENPGQYVTPEGDRPFDTHQTIIGVKGEAARTVQLRWTRHGPVIPAPHFGISNILGEGFVASLGWTALSEDDHTIEAMLNIQRSTTRAEAIEHGRLVIAPSQNLTMADKDGVAIKALGRQPKRDPGSLEQGRYPTSGWNAVNDWQGYIPYENNPESVDPESGIVANTNNRITDEAFPEHWSFDWGDTHRIQRITRLLNGREFHTLDSFVDFQTDTVSPVARSLLPLIARNLWFQGEPASPNTRERQRQIALEALAAWNGEMSEHSFEPLVYAAWTAELQKRLISDELGPMAARFRRVWPLFIERVFRDRNGASIWCDIKQSSQRETCEDISRLALDAALLRLSETINPRIETWRWGEAHQAQHRHTTLGRLPIASWLVNIEQDTPGGDFTLLRGQSSGRGDRPFTSIHGSGYRSVVDFADPESSLFIISTGQSGHFLSRHYDDLSILWRRGEYIPMALNPEVARGGAVGITHLSPKTAD